MKKLIAGTVMMAAMAATGVIQAAPLAGTFYNLRTDYNSALPVGGTTGFDAFTDMSNSSPGPVAGDPASQWPYPMSRSAGALSYQAYSEDRISDPATSIGLQAGHADASHNGFLSIQDFTFSGYLNFGPGVRAVGADFFGSGGTDIGTGGPCQDTLNCKWEALDGATITVRITDVNGDTFETTLANIGALDDATRFFGFISNTDLMELEFFIPEANWGLPNEGPYPSIDSLTLYTPAAVVDVPLPGTLALIGLGLMGLDKRRRHAGA